MKRGTAGPFLRLNCRGNARNACRPPGATHLFEEPGTLDQAAHQVTAWFAKHLLDARLQRAAYGAQEIGD
jgi:hypothetical protein